jgi:hypothetical protein
MLKIEISKRFDGSGVLICTREDGTTTWQKQTRLHAAHFALHDLTHYVVENSLGYRRGFFGLIAEGWDMEDTGGKGSRGALPAEVIEVERIVGLFDAERGSGVLWTAQEFNDFSPRVLTNEQIQNIRARRADLFRRWFDIAPAEKLELIFETLSEPSSRPSTK